METHRSAYIRMNQVQGLLRLVLTLWERLSDVLPQSTTLAVVMLLLLYLRNSNDILLE